MEPDKDFHPMVLWFNVVVIEYYSTQQRESLGLSTAFCNLMWKNVKENGSLTIHVYKTGEHDDVAHRLILRL